MFARFAIMFVVGALAAGGGYLAAQALRANPDPAGIADIRLISQAVTEPVAVTGNKRRPEFAFTDLDGNLRNVQEWDGRLLVVNFWATWCPPCREEIPLFVELQREYGARGLQLVGIAVDEVDAVRAFAQDIGINYPILLASFDGIDLSEAFGNRVGALPFTAVVDRAGRIVLHKSGEIEREDVSHLILSHL